MNSIIGCEVRDGILYTIYSESEKMTSERRNKRMKIKIKIHNPNCTPTQMKGGDWIDLRTAQDVELQAGQSMLISLGVSMQLPDGYEAHIVPRSSLFKRTGIIQTNSMGVVDNSYCGDNDIWCFPAYATRNITLKEGERICQFRIVKRQEAIEFDEVKSLDNEDRGGFGSTGTK